MSKNAKKRLKEFQERRQKEDRLAQVLASGVMLGEDCVDVETLLNPEIVSDAEIAEVLWDAGFSQEEVGDGRALIKRLSKGHDLSVRVSDRLLGPLEGDVLDPECPRELVEQDLREAGLDPEEVGENGRKLAERLLRKRKRRTCDVLERAVEEGVAYGWRRAHKHVSEPTPEHTQDAIKDAVMSSVRKWFEFE